MSSKIVEEISKMTVMELVEVIKEIEDKFGVSAAAPVAAVAAAPAAAGEVEAEKTEFKVTLKDMGAEKIKVIKALRTVVSSLSLKDAKEKVESAPCTIAEAVPKEEANKMKETLEAAGAKVELS